VAHELYPAKEARDGALAAGMEHGIREMKDQLEELVASLVEDARGVTCAGE
jgi:hypothetical protein